MRRTQAGNAENTAGANPGPVHGAVGRPPAGNAEGTAAGQLPARRQAGAGFPARQLLGISRLLLLLSFMLLPLSAFPAAGPIGALYPERPSYLLSLIGMGCCLASLQWRHLLREHRRLLILTGLFILYGIAVSVYGALCADTADGQYPIFFSVFNFIKRKAVPTLYVVWAAFLLVSMPAEKARGFYTLSLLALFIPNAAHMLPELLANLGCDGVRDLLAGINPYFRQVNTSHGNWPPPYFTDRVRGLFAEPSHLAYALTPVAAFFFYKLQKNILYILPLLFIFVSYIYKIPTITGILSTAFLMPAFFVYIMRNIIKRHIMVFSTAAILIIFLPCVYIQRFHEKAVSDAVHNLRETEKIAAYCKAAQALPESCPPKLDIRGGAGSLFTRAANVKIELDIAVQHPLGMGFYLSGFYYKPLLVWKDVPQEFFQWIALAFRDPVPVIPQLCEYGALASDLGIPGLCLFLLLCLHVARCARRKFRESRDDFMLFMLFSLGASMLTLFSVALKSGFMFYYFLGFMYALSNNKT
ncbi:MAG: hypothetical protein LBQ51_00120 [Desulfovibrio sp.]|jgi:hypothetical protein|nr:hypothetical protein [Desulfovibrio sp.]